MADVVPNNWMALFSGLVRFTAAHHHVAEAVGQDLDHLLARRGRLELGR